MTKGNFTDALSLIDSKYIDSALKYRSGGRRPIRRALLIAACAAIISATAIGIFLANAPQPSIKPEVVERAEIECPSFCKKDDELLLKAYLAVPVSDHNSDHKPSLSMVNCNYGGVWTNINMNDEQNFYNKVYEGSELSMIDIDGWTNTKENLYREYVKLDFSNATAGESGMIVITLDTDASTAGAYRCLYYAVCDEGVHLSLMPFEDFVCDGDHSNVYDLYSGEENDKNILGLGK